MLLFDDYVWTNGTVYFEAINLLSAYPTQISVDIATNMFSASLGETLYTVSPDPASTNGFVYVWETLDVLSLNAATTNDFTRYARRLNNRGSAKLRIRRMDYQSGVSRDYAFTVIDNIRVSVPPSDVTVAKTEAPFAPGYPSVGTNVTVRCYVSNVDTNLPTDSRSVSVVYRWRYLSQMMGAWCTNIMSYVVGTGDGAGSGTGNRYEAELPSFADAGDLEYYFTCDFSGYRYQSPDYTGKGYQYPSEALPPRTLRGIGAEYSVRLRSYKSHFAALYAETDQQGEPIAMTLTGDNEWRALVSLADRGITNLTWCFKGVGEHVAEVEAVSTGVTYWAGLGDVPGGRLPCGGACVATNASGRLSVSVNTGAYAMLTLNTDTLQYRACRAEYQNFNAWPAPANVFSDRIDQGSRQSYLNTFDAWPTNVCRAPLGAEGQGMAIEPINGSPSATNVYLSGPFTTPRLWVAGNAAYVSERPFDIENKPAGQYNFRNLALKLKGSGDDLDLGYVRNALPQLPDGLKEFGFKCRLGQGMYKTDIAYSLIGFTNSNYGVDLLAQTIANSRSPETPSLSVIGYYHDADHFYEYRVTHIKDMRDTEALVYDQGLRHELLKWVDGVATRLAYADVTGGSLIWPAYINMRFYNKDTTHTLIKCNFGASDRLNVTDSSATFQSGSFGVLSAECQAIFSQILTRATDSSANFTGASTLALTATLFDSQAPNWHVPVGQFALRGDVSPKGIYSVLPNQQLGVFMQDTVFGSGTEPTAPGGAGWKLACTVPVQSFSYQVVTVPVNAWQSQYVMLKVLSGATDVVVDEMAVSSWHGVKSGLGDTDPLQWLASEAWVVSNATAESNVVQLDHSRANPECDQAVRSLLLTNGLGVMEFDYRVIRPPAKLTVQYASQRAPDLWTEVSSFIVTNAAGWTHACANLGLPRPGYFRLLNAREESHTNALVEVNDVTVWDALSPVYAAWRAYNAKITQTDTNRVALDESKACFLNNSKTLDAVPPQTEFEPFLQSPVLPKGLGEITFDARAYTNSQASTLFLYATTSGWNAPTNLWFEICRFENITNTFYMQYRFKPPDGSTYDAVRLGTKTASDARRVCLEEIVIVEPLSQGVGSGVTLADALDVTNALVVSTGGDAAWEGRARATFHDGVDAAQSGRVSDGQRTWFEAAVSGPGTLVFWWRTSCQDDPGEDGQDYLWFSVDGVEQSRLGGITEWQQITCLLEHGSHNLRWEHNQCGQPLLPCESPDALAHGSLFYEQEGMPGFACDMAANRQGTLFALAAENPTELSSRKKPQKTISKNLQNPG